MSTRQNTRSVLADDLALRVSAVAEQLDRFCADSLTPVATSSFQTQSLPLLHALQQLQPGITIAFLDTGYHFDETIDFRDRVAEQLDLNLLVVSGHEPANSTPLYVRSENDCCNRNKVEPLHDLMTDHGVWISGVRADQTDVRKRMDPIMPGPRGTLRYHPILDWTGKDIDRYRATYDLPAHPLDALGYRSIGCTPCTTITLDDDRSGRWADSTKTECGLHLEPALSTTR